MSSGLKSSVLLYNPSVKYLADNVILELLDYEIPIQVLEVERSTYLNGERYYRLCIDSSFDLLGKVSVYIGAVVNDDDILDLYRVGSTLVHYGIRRRIFVISYLAYSSIDRAKLPGEVVTAKCTNQMLSIMGSADEGNVFIFLDLHYPGLIHYFEGQCLRIELYLQEILINGVLAQNYNMDEIVFGSTDLNHASWVNSFARSFSCPVTFSRSEVSDLSCHSKKTVKEIVGNVRGKHVIIFDDMIRTGNSMLEAAQAYIAAGAKRVDGLVSHLAFSEEDRINDILNSPINTIITTNSHPSTNHPWVKNSKRFVILDLSPLLGRVLSEMLPSTRNYLRRPSL